MYNQNLIFDIDDNKLQIVVILKDNSVKIFLLTYGKNMFASNEMRIQFFFSEWVESLMTLRTDWSSLSHGVMLFYAEI